MNPLADGLEKQIQKGSISGVMCIIVMQLISLELSPRIKKVIRGYEHQFTDWTSKETACSVPVKRGAVYSRTERADRTAACHQDIVTISVDLQAQGVNPALSSVKALKDTS